MLKERVENKIGKVTEDELEYALEKITVKINKSSKYFDYDFQLYDLLIKYVLEKRQKGAKNV